MTVYGPAKMEQASPWKPPQLAKKTEFSAEYSLASTQPWPMKQSQMIVPSVIFAWYHVPGHGPSRLVDTLILSLVFAWMARRYTFFAPLVMHYVFDAVMTMSLGKMPNIPASEVTWIAAHSTALNSAWTIALLLWIASVPALVLRRRMLGRQEAQTTT